MKHFFARIFNILFPIACIGCHADGTLLCGNCINRTPFAPRSPHQFIHTIFDYRTPLIRNAIWKFKYRHVRGIAKSFAPYLYDHILGIISDEVFIPRSGGTTLIPIPLHKNRLRERGYNQSELLVQEILKLDTAHIFSYQPNMLVRTRNTKPQAKSEKRKVRLENLSGAFSANNSLVRGKDIVLIDDVTTTGATLIEARKALRAAGARSVRACTIAH